MSSKQELRREMRNRKQFFTKEELQRMSSPVIRQLLANGHVLSSHTVLLYYSLPDEVFTHVLADKLSAMGKRVLLPVVTDESHMELREYAGRAGMVPGAYGIMEPQGPRFTDAGAIDLAIVPGMGFDPQGNRLGRGKGYYDRMLASMPNAYRIGVCFGFQMASHVPHGANDIRMNEVVAAPDHPLPTDTPL